MHHHWEHKSGQSRVLDLKHKYPPSLIFFLSKWEVFSFFSNSSPCGGSKETSFLTLHGSPTLRAPFLALRGKKKLSTRDFNVS